MRGLLVGALLVLFAAVAGAPAHADVLGVPVPRGTRVDEDDRRRLVSGAGYRDTVDLIRKWLDRQGIPHQRVGPYRLRGVDVTRFVSDRATTPWLAIHVYRQAGKTWISVIPKPAPDPS